MEVLRPDTMADLLLMFHKECKAQIISCVESCEGVCEKDMRNFTKNSATLLGYAPTAKKFARVLLRIFTGTSF